MDEHQARAALLDTVNLLRRERGKLLAIQRALPVPADQDAMFALEAPYDVATMMSAAIEFGLAENLDPFATALEDAATATPSSLEQDFHRLTRRLASGEGAATGDEPCTTA